MIITKKCAKEMRSLRLRLEKKLRRKGLNRLECAMLDFVKDLLGRTEVAIWPK